MRRKVTYVANLTNRNEGYHQGDQKLQNITPALAQQKRQIEKQIRAEEI